MAIGTGEHDPILLAGVALVGIPYVGMAYWVYRNASRRGSDRALAWGAGMLLAGPFGLLVFGLYYLVRGRIGQLSEPPTRGDRLVRNALVAWILVFLVSAVASPPDPFTQLRYAAIALPVLIALAVLVTYRDVLAGAVRVGLE